MITNASRFVFDNNGQSPYYIMKHIITVKVDVYPLQEDFLTGLIRSMAGVWREQRY